MAREDTTTSRADGPAAGLIGRVDDEQRRRRALGLPVAVFKRFGDHDGGVLAATISYFSFFSVFPLMLSFVTVLGIVLEDRPETRKDLVDGALGQIPLLGSQLADSSLTGSTWQLVVGLALAIWAGMGAVNALQHGLDVVADIPKFDRVNLVGKRVRAVIELLVLAVGVALSVFLVNMASIFDLGIAASILGFLGNVVTYTLVMLATFWVLPSRRRPIRELLPGAVVSGIGVAIVQALGFWITRRWIAGASDSYGTFATVIALLSYFLLIGRIVLLGAELNGVLASGATPRSLTPAMPITEGDRRAAALDAERVQTDPRLTATLD